MMEKSNCTHDWCDADLYVHQSIKSFDNTENAEKLQTESPSSLEAGSQFTSYAMTKQTKPETYSPR